MGFQKTFPKSLPVVPTLIPLVKSKQREMNGLLQEVRRLRSDLVTKTKSAYESFSGNGRGDSAQENPPPVTTFTESEKTQLAMRLSTIALPGAYSTATEQDPKLNASQDRQGNSVRNSDNSLDLEIQNQSSKLASFDHKPIEELQSVMREFQKMTLKEDADDYNAKKKRGILCLRVSLLIFILLFILLWVGFRVIKKA
jgi:hypothetical protein